MSRPTVLVVENDLVQAHQVTRAIEQQLLLRPVRLPTGEAAVFWSRSNLCDACVLDYQLPGIDGLETLGRLRQRQPELPVLMVSGAHSEAVAVAAFRAGVADYLPKAPGFPDAVARRLRQLVGDRWLQEPAARREPGVAEALYRPTYQNRLRVIGRRLDVGGYRSVNFVEIPGGFLVRAIPPRSRAPEALEFPDRDFVQLVDRAIEGRGGGEHLRTRTALMPTGYEDLLRALGAWLDLRLAEAITIAELDGLVVVGGLAKLEGSETTTIAPFHELLGVEDVAHLLDEAFQRRHGPRCGDGDGSRARRLLPA